MIALTVFSTFCALLVIFVWAAMEFTMPRLERSQCPPLKNWPKLSIVIPIRNEARNLEKALRSVLMSRYPNREIIAVDDRSDDQTPQILSALQREFVDLKVIRVQSVPQGWLGKNHALQQGYLASRGELVLFTDADIVFQTGSLERAVAKFEHDRWDHMAALIAVRSPSPVMKCLITFFSVMFVFYSQPWRVKNPKSKAFLGVGAFNLFRRKVLHEIDGLSLVRMRPDDDIKLGKLVKRRGYRQIAIAATHDISVEWYTSIREAIRAFEKNMFAGFDYNLAFMILGTGALLMVHVLPSVVPFFATGVWQTLSLISVAVLYAGVMLLARLQGSPLWTVAFYVPSALLMTFIFIRTAYLNLSQGGLQWRDTFYKLEDLKKNKV